MKITRIISLILVLAMIFTLFSCSIIEEDTKGGSFAGIGTPETPAPPLEDGDEGATKDDAEESDKNDTESDEKDEEEGEEEEKKEEISLPAGMITAGCWVDNDNYQLWIDLFSQKDEDHDENGKFYNYTKPNSSWGFDSLKRVKVNVTCDGNAVAGATVEAFDLEGEKVFSAVTNAQGNAYIFTIEEEGSITVLSGEGSASVQFTKEERDLAVELDSCGEKLNVLEIMFVVDVTGSMGDELEFLKAEIADVVSKIDANDSETKIMLSLLFYRDSDDAVPFDFYEFVEVSTEEGMTIQQEAINKQSANGGGDYPEAVDEALQMAVDAQWSTGGTTKLIFHVLDAPSHQGNKYEERFLNAVLSAAEKGIRINPILCSGSAELTEYTMRQAAIYTGGTFIFVTDDSGIGGSHHDPELPNVTVELLNSMLVRLVKGYHTGTFEPPVYWKNDPNLSSDSNTKR